MILSRLEWETTFWETGARVVAGVDEVGRGALAGPLVAAAVALDPACMRKRAKREALLKAVKDSKLLSPRLRVLAFPLICDCAISVAIGVAECEEIDDLGLAAANRIAMERAVAGLDPQPEILILDAVVLDVDLPQIGLIDGDYRCVSVAAASIIAKVSRDRLMMELGQADDRFDFADHCGYGTPAHLRAIRKHGPSAVHRKTFRPVLDALEI